MVVEKHCNHCGKLISLDEEICKECKIKEISKK